MVASQRTDIQEQYEELPIDQVVHGDCLEVLKRMPDNSVSAIVTDPPAGIGFMMSKKAGRTWDSDKGGRDHWIAWLVEIMREAFRVIKPGGHALVWALPRTSHWTGMALEQAGFQVRDVIYNLVSGDTKLIQFLDGLSQEQRHAFMQLCESQEAPRGVLAIFGSGFPKSYSIGKATGRPEHQGLGSSLKPACENWILVRKPLDTSNWLVTLTPEVLATWEERRCAHA